MDKCFFKLWVVTSFLSSLSFTQPDPYVINDFNTSNLASNDGDDSWWTEYDETEDEMNFSILSFLEDAPDNDSPVMNWNYGVVGTSSWGGYSAALKFFDQSLNFSNYNYISFKLRAMDVPELENMSFRLCLFDVSDATSWTSREDVEVWFSFFEGVESPLYFIDSGWVEYRIPLQESSTGEGYSQGFIHHPDWIGIEGNNQLDKNRIGGLAIEIVNFSPGSEAQGSFLMEDLQAIYSEDIPGCRDESACNYNPEATIDDGSCYDCANVTLVVDMTLQDTHPEGVYIAGGNVGEEGILMEDSDGDDIWEKTLNLEIGSYVQFKYRNSPGDGNWGGQWESVPSECDTGNYSDRYLFVPEEDTVLDPICFGECVSCESLLLTLVTFVVNMQEEVTNSDGVYLAGGDLGEAGYLMEDPEGDDIWVKTLSLTAGQSLAYKFRNGPGDGNWGGDWEEVPASCAYGEYSDRQITTGTTNIELPTVCFSRCTDCVGDYPIDVTFSVDMSDVTGFDTSQEPFVFGSFNNWNYFGSQTYLSDDDGDGTYIGTVNDILDDNSITYLFGYGQSFETLPSECSIYDTQLNVNVRELSLSDANGDTTLILNNVPFGGCEFNYVNVTFVVNMEQQETNPEGVYLAGGIIGDEGYLMDDTNEDDIWTKTLPLISGQTFTYKFRNSPSDGNWGGAWEEVPQECAVGEFLDREITIGNEDFTIETVCFSGCVDCALMNNDFNENSIAPTRFLCEAYPNPFNPEIKIFYELPNQDLVSLSIFNLLGQRIIKLVDNHHQDIGRYSYKWDGKDFNGTSVNSGIYFAVIETKSIRKFLKITYLK